MLVADAPSCASSCSSHRKLHRSQSIVRTLHPRLFATNPDLYRAVPVSIPRHLVKPLRENMLEFSLLFDDLSTVGALSTNASLRLFKVTRFSPYQFFMLLRSLFRDLLGYRVRRQVGAVHFIGAHFALMGYISVQPVVGFLSTSPSAPALPQLCIQHRQPFPSGQLLDLVRLLALKYACAQNLLLTSFGNRAKSSSAGDEYCVGLE